MAGETVFGFRIKVGADISSASSELNKFTENLKQKPLVVPIDLGKADTSQSEKFREQIKQQAIGLDEIIVKTRVIENIKTGEQTRVATEQTRKWTDAVGATHTEVTKLKGALDGVQKGFREIGTETSTQKVTSQQQKLTKEYEAANKSIQGMAESAKQFMAKSENMTGKQVDEAKKSGDALLKVSRAWDEAYHGTGDDREEKLRSLKLEMEKLNKEFNINEAGTRRGAGALRGWAENMQNAIKQTISYTLSLGAMRLAQQAFNQAVEYAIDLNKEMVNIQLLQVEGAKTPEDLNALAQSYNGLAKELGATTLEVARGSVEWLRQGKTIEETEELLRASTMLSKLGNIEAAEATEYLTSTINSFKMSAEDAVSIVDKLVAVDNIAATSTKELATALKYVAAVAGETGVSLEQLISYVGVISSTTRLNAESIGQALKTMLTRMQDIRAGKIDEDGLGINNVAIALERVDVALMESETEFRDFGTVLEDIAGKWDTLNEVEQANISKAIAGVRQANMFTILMTNMSQALEYQKEQLNASGLAMNRYGFYMESVEAKQNQLKASMEGLYQDALKDGMITGFYDLGIQIIDLIDDIGGLTTIVYGLIASLLVLKSVSIVSFFQSIINILLTVKAGFLTTTAALELLNVAILASPWFWAAAAIAVVTGALYLQSKEIERLTKKYDELNKSAKEASSNYYDAERSIANVNRLWNEFKKLEEIEEKTEAQTRRLIEVQNELNNITNGNISGEYDAEMNFMIDKEAKIEDIISLLREEADVKREIAQLELEAAVAAGDKLEDALQKEKERLKKVGTDEDPYLADLRTKMSEEEAEKRNAPFVLAAKQRLKEIELLEIEHTKNVVNLYKSLRTEEERQNLLRVIDNQKTIDAIVEYENQQRIKAAGNVYNTYYEDEYLRGAPDKPLPVPSVEEYAIALETAKESLTALDEALDKLRENEAVDKQVSFLEGLGIVVDNVDGKWVVAQDSVDNYKSGVADAVSAGYDLTDSMEKGLQDVVGSFNNVVNGVSLTKSQFVAYTSDMSQAIWNLATSSGAALADTKGRALNSAQAIATAMATNQATYNSLIVQMTSASASELAKLAQFASGLLLSIRNLSPYVPQIPTFGGGGGGGGGGSSNEKTPEELEKERLQEEIKGWEKEKKVWKEKLDAFKKYIKAQKEALKLKKEEVEFNRKLEKKNKDLAELQAEIALLALDNSEEANARRLELMQEAADLEVEIAEDKEDRKYELQVEALDKAQDQYEEFIEAQIDALDKFIEKNNELIEALEKLIQSMTGSGGGGGGFPAASTEVERLRALLEFLGVDIQGLSDEQILYLGRMIDKWHEMGWAVEDYLRLLQAAAEAARNNYSLESINEIARDVYKDQHDGKEPPATMHHQGGLVESHHTGDFAGNLRSNEVFSKLLKGEYVATEGQMNNFMKNILPRIASEIPTSSKSGAPVISLSMPITVEGNLDKSVIPDLDKIADKVIKEINTSLKQRGYVRQTTLTGYV